jgi:glyoxalase family protein
MPGLHHVTAFAGNAARNVGFYRDMLGLRLIKTTVNFDDPGTWHLYFGDYQGQPGTVLTFFPHEHAAPGRAGTGETTQSAFAVPEASLGWWGDRFTRLGIPYGEVESRFGEKLLPFTDRDGTSLAIVAVAAVTEIPGNAAGDVPAAHAIRGFHGVTLTVTNGEATAAILTGPLGFVATAREGNRERFIAPGQPVGGIVDLVHASASLRGRPGGGTVHHIAFRARDDADQVQMAARLTDDFGMQVTEQKERNYFRSVYFREPSGVLFEIATDDPGFAVDEPLESLGQRLMLPEWLEHQREAIVLGLPSLV